MVGVEEVECGPVGFLIDDDSETSARGGLLAMHLTS